MVVQCYWLFDRYYKYPIEVKMDMKVSSSLEFPSVTICNLNPIIQSKVFYKPYKPLIEYVDPTVHDSLFQEAISNWQFHVRCDNTSYKCNNGQCIYSAFVCDGFLDCMTGEDEANCTEVVCGEDYAECNSSDKCISKNYVCDGLRDCWYGEDESFCSCKNTESSDSLSHSKVCFYFKIIHKLQLTQKRKVNRRFLKAREHLRLKRHVRSTEPPKNTSVQVDWKTVLINSSFNKWNFLDDPSITANYYEERDEEYQASMTYAYITAKLDPLVVEESGHLKNDLIAACRFGGYQCSPANFTYFHSYKYGNCYTFNSKKSANGTDLYTKFPGPEYGLRLELFLDQENYVPYLATEAGIRVLVHRKGTMPFPEDEGISIMPGRSTSIGIRQVSFTRLPPPHGVCSDKAKRTDYYEKSSGNLVLNACNCSVPFYYVLENTTICNMTEMFTEMCVNRIFMIQGENIEKCDQMCPIPCNDTKYELSVSMAIWPSERYQSFLINKLGQTNYKYMETEDSASDFTKLQIYFQDLIYEQVEQQKAYESMSLISDLGGQLGLWLGLSAITIGEICSFLFGVGRSLSYKCWGNKTMQDDLTPITTIQPATLQEMYEDLCPEAAKYLAPEGRSTSLSDSAYA
ncbi:unnamed protein product [Candidula unifasciata]|uniref:Uncharacterized protein n=1 Tax=Candidula unifasciata TaxID=100452 RepID=A0A8S3ZUX4_9EUPU|nr:unnamed protein product [Candidula unifasciata]